MQITNKKGEKLYLVVRSKSNDISPYTGVKTWEKAMEDFNDFTEDVDNEAMFRKTVKKNIDEGHRAIASCIENRKGWGSDYMVYIEVSPLYDFGR